MKHILMVDDVSTNLKMAAEVLGEHYRLSMAKSGAQAMQLLEKARPDLILLDINMPDINGYEMLERLRASEETQDIPVIFVTADIERESEIRGLNMGAMDFMRKPLEPDVLLSRIQRVLQIDETRKNLEIAARKDVLTGLWNRQYMERFIAHQLEDGSDSGCFVLLDLDNFKWVNDHMGHIAGDHLLIAFARGIELGVQGQEAVISRLGGDEFAVFLPRITTGEMAKTAALRLQMAIESQLYAQEMYREQISVSIGMTLLGADNRSFTRIYHQADKALYYVKQNGKQGFHLYKPFADLEYRQNESGVAVDLEQIEGLVEEKISRKGAYLVEQEGFRNIYQFIARYIDRTKLQVQILLMTLYPANREAEDSARLEAEMCLLGEEIGSQLRRGDVSTRFSSTQYVVILMDASEENGHKIADRILNAYRDRSKSDDVAVRYDVRQIKTNGEKS